MSISGKLQGLTEKGWKTYIATVEKTCTCLSMTSNKRSLGGVICGGCVKMVIPKPPALVETLVYTNAELCSHEDASDISLSTCVAERIFSGTKRLKMPLRSTVSDERLSSLAFFHVHKHKEVDRRRPSYLRVCWEERSLCL